ncbi:MAG: MgtC/SapB family protein [Rhodopseudomonas sp.]|nr:MgtC/SapB family protein [Rhodopseudomonas sp.]
MDIQEVTLRLVAAVLVGGAIGLNRDLHAKQTGVRTLSLVSLGCALAVLASLRLGQPGDTTRVIQGIVTGIGFLGAGVIVRPQGGLHIHGLTTAASVWFTACVGVACAVADWQLILVALVLSMLILIWGGIFEKAVRRRFLPPDELPRDDGPAC